MDIAVQFGRFPQRPSDLFLKLFYGVICTLERDRSALKWGPELATEVNVPQYGQLDNGARFIRCDTDQDPFETFVRIIVKDVGAKPKLLVSCYGGAEYFTMTDDLEREFINGIGQVAATKDVWILTTGLNSGVSGLIAQGVHRNTLLNKNTWKPIVIGMSHWGTISEFTRDVLKQQPARKGRKHSHHHGRRSGATAKSLSRIMPSYRRNAEKNH
ncbi:unnamed protein product [Rotaria sordida]|uniref:TRPM SLOG domain-containing protein n=1 Tax=Rotaria sordida TaxID=392033 RepID=A0A815LK53_9BILA|nr:unnamed protein product [Rotaria sordida]